MRFADFGDPLVDQTFLVQARGPGQFVRFNGVDYPAVEGEFVRVAGSGQVLLSEGFWGRAGVFDGDYPGSWVVDDASAGVVSPLPGVRGSVTIYNLSGSSLAISAAPGTGQYRLTEGAHTGFRTGDGVPKVLVKDPDRTLQMISGADALSDYQITLEEIG